MPFPYSINCNIKMFNKERRDKGFKSEGSILSEPRIVMSTDDNTHVWQYWPLDHIKVTAESYRIKISKVIWG